jgi:hypothetical protein
METAHLGVWSAIVWGGLAAGIGDSLLALVLYRVPLPIIYQSIAAGLLGRDAYSGGLAVYVSASRALPLLARQPVPCGLAFGIAVYLFMKYVVLPLSAVTRLTPFDPAAMIGHAVLVGLPIALFARR